MIHFTGSIALGPDDLDAIDVNVQESHRPGRALAAIHIGGLTVMNGPDASPAGLVHVLRHLADLVDEEHDRWLATHPTRSETPDDPS